MKVLDSKFIKNYKKDMIDSIKSINPKLSKSDIEPVLDKMIQEQIKVPEVELDNNYTHENKKASLLSVFDWALERNPIIAGNGTFYKNQHDADNPTAEMLQGFLSTRKSIKKEMFAIEDTSSREYKDKERGQGNEKTNVNSYYGGSGMKTSAFYSTWSGPATTLSAQSVISTTETTFESFVGDNYLYIDGNEAIHWMNVVLKDSFELDPWVNTNVTVEMVTERIYNKIIGSKAYTKDMIREYIKNLSIKDRVRVYYKNNLIQFMDDHSIMHDIYNSIFTNVKNLDYVDEHDPLWRDTIKKYKVDVSKFKKAKDWNAYVNKQYFLDPNDVPDTIDVYVKQFSDIMIKYVYVRYMPFDRIYRLKNFKRNVVTVIDTDSNILSLDTWINHSKQYSNDTYGRTDDKNEFIAVNVITYIITNVVKDILEFYGESSNIPEEFRHWYNMKNEFYFAKLVIGNTKKRYLSKILLREGNLYNPPRYDIKGFDFMKATTAEESERFFKDISKRLILDPENINVRELLNEILAYENKIYESIRSGELTYLPIASAKDFSSYKQPEQEQSVRGVLAWNILYPDDMIEVPSKVKMVKLNIFTPHDIDKLQRTNMELYNTIMSEIFDDKTGIFVSRTTKKTKNGDLKCDVKSRGMQVLAIPAHELIPEWALEFIDYKTMVNNALSPYRPVLEVLGIPSASVGKTINTVNRKSDKITNIVRF